MSNSSVSLSSVNNLNNINGDGTAWVEGAIQQICCNDKLPSVTASWLPESNDLFVALSIVSKDGKRVSRLFSQYELASCSQDTAVQAQLLERIAHLLKFLYPEKRRQKQA